MIEHDDGMNRRKVLECMTWAGTGVLWTVAGGVPTALGIIDEAVATPVKGFTFLQISDSHKGSGDKDHGPNPSLAPLEKGPFYAIKVLPGSFGTFAGLKADAQSRVLNSAGDPIPGLWVAGSDQANVMGGHYPSGGINIGPAMTFGYIAGRNAAGVTDYENILPEVHNEGV